MSNFWLTMIILVIIGIYFLFLDLNTKSWIKKNQEILFAICPPMIENFFWCKKDNCTYRSAIEEWQLVELLKRGKVVLKSEKIIGNGYRKTDINRTYEIVEDAE